MTYSMDGWQEPTLAENLKRAGVSRRDFLKFCGGLAAIFAAGSTFVGPIAKAHAADPSSAPAGTPSATQIANALGSVTKPNVIWLQLQECTGCVESVLRSGGTTVEDIVLNLLSVNYNEAVMAAAGDAANAALAATEQGWANQPAGKPPRVLVVNGSVPTNDNGIYCTIGGETAEQVLKDAAANADVILAVGACAVWGSVQASNPNPTGAVGVDQIITNKPVVNVSGCPPIGEVITATISYLLTYGEAPKLDAEGRPLFAFGQRIHDACPRRPHFDAGQYVRTFDDDGAREGWCLYHMGCKGPSTFAACPVVQWNLHTRWPIGAGHPCLGCTEKHFFDRFTPFYQDLPNIPGFGIEGTAEKVGLGLVGAAVVGVGLHAGITAAQRAASKKSTEAEPLAAFGDEEPAEITSDSSTPSADTGTTDTNETGKAE